MHWLITGFEPFGGETLNPSELLAKSLALQMGMDHLILPVSYERSFEMLRPFLQSGKYQGLLSLGQAGGRSKITLERVALNLEDTEQADSDQDKRIEKSIDTMGPHAVMNPLPLRQIVTRLRGKMNALEVSTSAGTFVCNSLYYKTFRWMEQHPGVIEKQLFVHVPYLPEQIEGKEIGIPFLARSVMEQALADLFRELQNP